MEQRVYPIGCTSAYCGRIECGGCPSLPALREFEAWRVRTQAENTDPIHARLVWTATTEGR